ncbi:PepSY domain-containing protein [Aureibacillus halotolerans]|uniref:Putative membrane protein YkoI n=1 Tax=Aureibacillus halotolerans TaxID=1508390 RepID=A0A4V6PWF2_9BACI|nr:PepSY domain-containing protein [Aureibacillus halotolerans]TDQ37427.1 putative membrane protein YkoI [Aureibacillus halotolerans]
MNKKISIALAGTLALGGLGFGSHALANEANRTVQLELEDDVTKQEATDAKVSVEQAKAIALKEVDGTVTEIELNKTNGELVYEVEVSVNNNDDEDVYVHAQSGAVVIDGAPGVTKGSLAITAAQAKEAAVNEAGGNVTDVDVEVENDHVYYEVEVQTNNGERTVYVDGTNGSIIANHADDDDDDDRENLNPANANVKISMEQAEKIALQQASGTIVEASLDEDDGRYEYEFEIQTNSGEAEVTIDANSGSVLEVELDD